MRRLKVLFLPHPLEEVNNNWGMDLITAIDPHHDLSIFDSSKAPEPQFENIEAVVDMGGNIGKELAQVLAYLNSKPEVFRFSTFRQLSGAWSHGREPTAPERLASCGVET